MFVRHPIQAFGVRILKERKAVKHGELRIGEKEMGSSIEKTKQNTTVKC